MIFGFPLQQLGIRYLSCSIHESQSLPTFRHHLKTFYFQSAYPLSAAHLAYAPYLGRWRYISHVLTYLLTYLQRGSRRPGQEYLHAAMEEVEEMLKTTCHIVIKALVKFIPAYVIMDTIIDLFETLYNISVFFQSAFKQCVVMNKQNAGCSRFFGATRYISFSFLYTAFRAVI